MCRLAIRARGDDPTNRPNILTRSTMSAIASHRSGYGTGPYIVQREAARRVPVPGVVPLASRGEDRDRGVAPASTPCALT
jgi:hypothetical protein